MVFFYSGSEPNASLKSEQCRCGTSKLPMALSGTQTFSTAETTIGASYFTGEGSCTVSNEKFTHPFYLTSSGVCIVIVNIG